MKLEKLLEYDDIVIQCHDIPDADTIASGYGLLRYLQKHGKSPRLIYGGWKPISKQNLLIMINRLEIPLEHIRELGERPQLIITADCIHGEGNVTSFEAENYAAVDHHKSVRSSSDLFDIRPAFGCCSSIIALLLAEAGYDYNDDEDLATALYYGLYTDTDELREISHPSDRDLRDMAKYNKTLITTLINSNMSLPELRIAGNAFYNVQYDEKHRFAVVCAEECDPNILGFINDLVLKVDTVDASVVCCRVAGGIKLSVRSCVNKINAAELAEYISDGIGSGGGGSGKAGGFINASLAPQLDGCDPTGFLENKVREYCECFDIINAESSSPDISAMKTYLKKPQLMGFVKSTDIFPEGTGFDIRTLEADLAVEAGENVYIMVGRQGNVYPISREKFENTYSLSDDMFEVVGEYSPTVISRSGDRCALLPYAKSCISKNGARVYAAALTRRTKLYTLWDKENYMSGKVGDYLVIRCDDTNDMYIAVQEQFSEIYECLDTAATGEVYGSV